LLQGQAVAISRTTDICALLFSGVSRSKGEGGEIGVARIECSRIQWQKECEEYGDEGKWPPATFHGLAPEVSEFGMTPQFVSEVQPLFVRNSLSHGIDHYGLGTQRL
jgi:hypothetical protein